MKAIALRSPGGLDNLALVDLPDAATPGPGEVRVRLHGSSLNYHDYGVCSRPGWKANGRIPMADGAGVVDAVGEGVTEFAPGEGVSKTWGSSLPLSGVSQADHPKAGK